MGSPPGEQLAFEFAGSAAPPVTSFAPTRPLRKHRDWRPVLKKLDYVRRYFPELAGQTIRVGLTRAASGMAVPGGHELWVNPTRLSYHTIAHEFVHLLQGGHGVPAGERSCDLYSLARHWTLNDTLPYYIRVPRWLQDGYGNVAPERAMLIYDVARRSLELRSAGLRNYIALFEQALNETKPASLFNSPLTHSGY